MPPPERHSLTDYAVLWTAATLDNHGEYKVHTPVEIRVRWEDSSQESPSPESSVQSISATVHLAITVAVGSIMWRGRLREVSDMMTDLYEVVGHSATPDIKGRIVQHVVTLSRHSDSLPEVV